VDGESFLAFPLEPDVAVNTGLNYHSVCDVKFVSLVFGTGLPDVVNRSKFYQNWLSGVNSVMLFQ